MRRALALARRAEGWTSPNPMVGAVLVKDGRVVGEGYHRRAGTPHAEAHALARAGEAARGATLYVNLEPCSHYGRTPPCADALIRAGVARVVAAMQDPNPRVAGRGLARLREAGVQVEVGLLEREARRLNEAFCKHVTTGLPFTVLKTAMSLDGKIATRTGHSRWITGEAARAEAHRLRHRADAVLVGVGTVLADDPRLTVRLPGGPWKNPWRVVVDSFLRTPPGAAMLQEEGRTIIATTAAAPARARAALQEAGAEVWLLPGKDRVDLPALWRRLGEEGVTHLLVEGGGEINAALLAAGLVDKVVAFVAPRIVGGQAAPGPVGGAGAATMEEALELADLSVRRVGRDVMLSGYLGGVTGCSPDW